MPTVYKDKKTGKYLLDESALFTRPYWLTTWPTPVVWGAAAVGATAAAAMQVPQEAPFLGEKFLVFRDTECLIKIRDNSTDRWITGDWVHIDSIAGTAQFPFLMRDLLWVDAGSDLHVEFLKLAVGLIGDGVDFHIEGSRHYIEDANIPEFTAAAEKIRRTQLNNYPCIKTVVEQGPVVAGLQVPGVVLGANAQAPYHVVVPNNYHFTAKKVTAVQADGTAPGAFSIRYYDHRGNELGNGALDSRAVMGTGLLPELLSQPFTIERNRMIRMVITDLSGAPNNFFLTLTGCAHYVMRKHQVVV